MTDQTTTIDQPTDAAAEQEPDEFAIVEIFGHRQYFGRIKEVERFGAKQLRIDVPTDGDWSKGFTTQYYAGAAIFSLTPTDERTVLRQNKRYHEPARLTYRDDDEDDDEAGDEPGREGNDPNQENLPL